MARRGATATSGRGRPGAMVEPAGILSDQRHAVKDLMHKDVGWVERSEARHAAARQRNGFRKGATHPKGCRAFQDVIRAHQSAPPERRCGREQGLAMSKPQIFTISAAWDDEASVWSGHCDDIPAAADAPTLDELLAKISAMALDLLPDNHPGVDPASVYLQITALREAEPAGA
jgi:hypothetical protein